MNITESNAVSLILNALQGDTTLNPDDVADAALMLKARIHAALSASPDVNEGLVLANTVLLQVSCAVDEAVEDEEPAPKAELEGEAKVAYDERVANQTKSRPRKQSRAARAADEAVKVVDIEDGKVVVKDAEPTAV